MNRVLISLLIVFNSILCWGQNGITFQHKSFDEVCEMAKKQKKLVFVDVYTSWCGPCYRMAKEVFTQKEVGEIVNDNFVSVKIDAETKEGRSFCKNYPTRSFPTYYFINPKNRKVLHLTGSYHEPAEFIRIIKNSMDKKHQSVYLENEYLKGNRKPKFLSAYMDYLALSYKRNQLLKVLDEFVRLNNLDLTDKEIGEIFFKHISDRNHPMFKEFISKREEMETLYGKERVETKIYEAYRWCRNIQKVKALKDFKGKQYIIEYNKLQILLKQKNYAEADKQIMSMINNPALDQKVVRKDIEFYARRIFKTDVDPEWFQYCVKYLQYFAYNNPDRNEASVHYNYAQILEKIIKDNPEIHKYFPKSVYDKPEIGKSKYSMRPIDLKEKPRRRYRRARK